MPYEQLTALALFVLVSSITPGPNNLMLMASGANFGVIRTLPHMAGITTGITVMVALVGIGIMRIFEAWPATATVLKAVSAAYLLYLAWKIATSRPPERPETAEGAGHPFSLLQAALFQWVNPKAWAMVVSAVSLYAPGGDVGAVLLIALVFCVVSLPAVSVWAVLGQKLRRLLGDPRRLRIFNGAIAALLVASLYPVLSL